MTIAPMTTQRQDPPLSADLVISKAATSFKATGLKKESWLLIDKIATLEKMFIEGILGRADEALNRSVNAKVAEC